MKSLLIDKKEIDRVVIEDEDGSTFELTTDLIIDASGAAALHNKWLSDSGFGIAPKTEVKIDLFYATMVYKRFSKESVDWHSLLSYPNPPAYARGGTISPIEGNRMLVTFMGYGAKDIPNDVDSFIKFAKTLNHSGFDIVLKNGLPFSKDIQIYRFPALRRYHLEKLKDFPSGLLVIGDAFCRIDPVFAQGMSLAAMEAMALKDLLMKEKTKKQMTKSYHKKVCKVIETPWLIALTEDFRFRTTSGRKPMGLPVLQWYVKKIVAASAHNEEVYNNFIQVLHLKKHPVSLATPRVLAKVFSNHK